MSTPAINHAELERLLNVPGQTDVPVKTLTAGEIQIIAMGPGPMDRVVIILQPGISYNLLEYAVASWWLSSTSLFSAVDNGWIVVDTAPSLTPPPVVPTPDQDPYIRRPRLANIGDLLVFDGEDWVVLSPGTSGHVFTSNGAGALPSYQPSSGGGGGGNVLTGQTTTGLNTGEFLYPTAANTWGQASSDGSAEQATVSAVYLGTANQVALAGSPVSAALFTTAGGMPPNGAAVFLAAAADDGGLGAGKLTATPPTTGYLTFVGVCVDNSNYAASKTCIVAFEPVPPIGL